MIYSSEADIIPFVKSITQGLQPYAQANDVHLSFSSRVKAQVVNYQPVLLSQSLFQVICNIISLIPPGSKIKVRLYYSPDKQHIYIEVENNRINLIRVNEVCAKTIYAFSGYPLDQGTAYRLALSLKHDIPALTHSIQQNISSNNLPPFYTEIQKRLRSHFNQTDKLIAALANYHPREAAFMQKINALIQANLEDEKFDSNVLSNAMCMSRTQLFRRLKSLIRQAPANYIRSLRLQRAKELLETTDLTVSEITFKCGFQTLSHFAKIFRNQYGIQPSVFRNTNKHATNG